MVLIQISPIYKYEQDSKLCYNHDCSVYVFSYKRILVIISHSQDFLNGVCTNIVHMQKKTLKVYGVSIVV